MEVANGLASYMPPANVAKLSQDGAALPLILAQPEDKVWIPNLISGSFKDALHQLGLEATQLLNTTEIKDIQKDLYATPWGESASVQTRLKKQFPYIQKNNWKSDYAKRYRRETALDVLSQLKDKLDNLSNIRLPHVCTSVDDVEKLHIEWQQVVLKAPLSSSGRGVLFLRKPGLHPSNKQWIQGVIDEQGAIMVEPMLDKVMDFSAHFWKAQDKVQFKGFSGFETNRNGKYMNNAIGEVIFPVEMNRKVLDAAIENLPYIISNHPVFKEYEGALGIDMLLFMENDTLRLQPCVEINVRYSMGTIAMALQALLAPETKGSLHTLFKKDVSEDRFYLEMDNGKVKKAFWPLTDFWQAEQFVFILEVNNID